MKTLIHNKMTANRLGYQIGGNHYKNKKIQPWEAMEAWMSDEQFAGFLRGNAIKYLARCEEKGGIEDLEKAKHYLDKLIEFRIKKAEEKYKTNFEK